MSILEQVLEQFPIRKTKAQKAAFRAWAVGKMTEMGYQAREEKKGMNVNVVAGDPDTAQVIFTGHYDTPAVMPVPNFITPCNIPVFMLYQVGVGVVMALLVFAVGSAAGALTKNPGVAFALTYLALVALMYLLMCGPANRNNRNDNTSGTVAVLEVMARIPQEQRGKCAFVLFDNEEKGMLGSSAFATLHKKVKKETLLINMDCVGDGENMLIFANKKTRALPAFAKLDEAMAAQEGRVYVPCKMEKCMYPSDQKCFAYGVAVCACLKGKRIGYYCDKIHTKKDVVCEQVNLDWLAEGFAKFVGSL